MKHVRNDSELEALRAHVSPAFYDTVKELFEELKEASYIPNVLGPYEFVLESGHIVVIEPEEPRETIINLLESWPEYAEKIEIPECTLLKIVVVEDNDFIMTYFTNVGDHPELDAWAEQYIDS